MNLNNNIFIQLTYRVLVFIPLLSIRLTFSYKSPVNIFKRLAIKIINHIVEINGKGFGKSETSVTRT